MRYIAEGGISLDLLLITWFRGDNLRFTIHYLRGDNLRFTINYLRGITLDLLLIT
jgi:hypothetical protein